MEFIDGQRLAIGDQRSRNGSQFWLRIAFTKIDAEEWKSTTLVPDRNLDSKFISNWVAHLMDQVSQSLICTQKQSLICI